MSSNAEAEALDRLARELDIDRPAPTRSYLCSFLEGFSRIVYENVSKIVLFARTADPARSLQTPEVLIPDYFQYGSGGTCFSLTYLAYRMLNRFGLPASILMGDRHYGPDTHCAVACPAEGVTYLLDVGFLIFEPLPLDPRRLGIHSTPINQIEVVPADAGRFEVFTRFRGHRKYRFTLKPDQLDGDAFRPFWLATFQFDMMRYPLVTQLRGGIQYYLQGTNWQMRTAEETRRGEMPPEQIPAHVHRCFGIDPALTRRAVELTLLAKSST
ncbi:MAG: arylamine N-acetyltransferase [Planctomycetes bacterium]|nr:arylamine N-acetyltransferase [Planctomycetota bacterium]